MTAHTYTIMLVDVPGQVNPGDANALSAPIQQRVAAVLGNWMQTTCGRASHGGDVWSSRILWGNPTPPAPALVGGVSATSPAVENIIMYFVPENSMSAIDGMRAYHPPPSSGSGIITGYTVFETRGGHATLAGSEVYTRRVAETIPTTRGVAISDADFGRALAQTAFHEMMHNQQHIGEALHRGNGLAGSNQPLSTEPSDQNYHQMASQLHNYVPQYRGGVNNYRVV